MFTVSRDRRLSAAEIVEHVLDRPRADGVSVAISFQVADDCGEVEVIDNRGPRCRRARWPVPIGSTAEGVDQVIAQALAEAARPRRRPSLVAALQLHRPN